MNISIVLRFCPVEQIRFRGQPIEVRADQTAGSIPQHKVEEESRRQPFQLGIRKTLVLLSGSTSRATSRENFTAMSRVYTVAVKLSLWKGWRFSLTRTTDRSS